MVVAPEGEVGEHVRAPLGVRALVANANANANAVTDTAQRTRGTLDQIVDRDRIDGGQVMVDGGHAVAFGVEPDRTILGRAASAHDDRLGVQALAQASCPVIEAGRGLGRRDRQGRGLERRDRGCGQ
ncbi:MAG: hypothetical protein Q7T71_08210 [Herbiconiux sp.]|nr:hypothetical protein [Herbiconiux sp.]